VLFFREPTPDLAGRATRARIAQDFHAGRHREHKTA
jgi:hypothetical protein